MVEVAFLLAVALLACGVLASFVPLAPGALLSLAGIYGYWWATGYAEPGTLFLAVATFIGLGALVLDYLASALSTRAGGASWRTTAIAAVVGLVLLPFTGPMGAVLGIALATLALEFEATGDVEASLRTAWYTLLGILLSKGLQVLLTGALLVAFLLVVW